VDLATAFDNYSTALVLAIAGGYDDLSGSFAAELAALEQKQADMAKYMTVPAAEATASFAGGGTISGPTSGYTVATQFHGTEHITPDSEMAEVKQVLKEVKGVLIELKNTAGDQNATIKKLHRNIDQCVQGGTAIRTQAA
jgi:hypothetical protein